MIRSIRSLLLEPETTAMDVTVSVVVKALAAAWVDVDVAGLALVSQVWCPGMHFRLQAARMMKMRVGGGRKRRRSKMLMMLVQHVEVVEEAAS